MTTVFCDSPHFTLSLSNAYWARCSELFSSFHSNFPLWPFPSDGVYLYTTFEMLLGSLLVVFPNHLNIFCLFWVMIFCWPVLLTCTLTGWWCCLASKFWISFFGIVCGILRPSRNLFEYWNYIAVVYLSFTHQADVGVFPYIIYLLKWDGCLL